MKSAKQGNVNSLERVAYCYAAGDGVEKDWATAALYWFQAAEKGDATSQYWLAICYKDGIGFKKDLIQAKEWMQKSANQGYDAAKKALDEMFD